VCKNINYYNRWGHVVVQGIIGMHSRRESYIIGAILGNTHTKKEREMWVERIYI
jgi:hypothetical protein